ncbi:MAG TPA: succinate dehydrogenase/fumarate reductase iron-sulfur subunit [Planctomycetaceae bacterium]|nr:succinate dehydrogenase/fumarate reductase iron-sulfur subunit [Planctomycetaceae bacterium]HIQ20905.1 succinate dehydrogenase/fumarate reductase iron-sulfur subunit [Planctomycetota bacterium]
MRFEIFRYDATQPEEPRFDVFHLTPSPGMSVLEAILRIQDEQDPSLSFRYACRSAVCGSCGMAINGRLALACRVQLDRLDTDRVVLEPMPNLEIIRDLVVDMDPFWEKYERVQPWLHAEMIPGQESRMSPKERDRIDQYVNCILCALCYAACPVIRSNEGFTGPAALAKLYRFLADPREQRDPGTLEQENRRQGVWGCHTITRCIQVCPKRVRPTDGIEGVRRKLVVHRFKKLVGKER